MLANDQLGSLVQRQQGRVETEETIRMPLRFKLWDKRRTEQRETEMPREIVCVSDREKRERDRENALL